VIGDAAGDLFGTTAGGGANGDGAVFEIPKTASGYGSETILYSFTGGADGANPVAGLIADTAGDLFGTTAGGGSIGDGAVFEIPKTAAGYGPETVLYNFGGSGDGASPVAGLIADAAGDLIGTTAKGGANGDGAVFEIPKTASGYGAETVLYNFTGGGDGANPVAGVIMDAAGDLFGTTAGGGANGDGAVFEIPKTASGYGSETVLYNFTGGGDGANPVAGVIMDAAGDLIGTTAKAARMAMARCSRSQRPLPAMAPPLSSPISAGPMALIPNRA